jgi:AcrR family transcriptional regulator
VVRTGEVAVRQTLRTRQKEQSRKKILQAAALLFREKGYAATGLDELMARAGLTSGAFYAHFQSKQQLLELTIDEMLQRSREILLKGTEALEGDEFLDVLLENYVSEAHRDRPGQGCPLPSLAAELYRESKDSPEKIAAHLNHLVDIMMKKQNELSRQAALLLLSEAVGAVLLSRMVKGEALSAEILEAIRDSK